MRRFNAIMVLLVHLAVLRRFNAIMTTITKITNPAPADAPMIILFFFERPVVADGAADGAFDMSCDVGVVPLPLSKLQLNVTFDIVVFAAFTSNPGLQMLIGAHGGLGSKVKTSLVRSPLRQSEL